MIRPFRSLDRRAWYQLAISGLVFLAWLALVVWGASPFGKYLSHEPIGESGLVASYVLVFMAGWVLMTVVMMLPSSLPLIDHFVHMIARRTDHLYLVILLILGYLSMWTVFGIAAYIGDSVLHEAVEHGLRISSRQIGAVLLLAAGIYQFLPLKHMCLDKCRSPYTFLVQNWTGKHAALDAFRLGLRHGLFCVGCCWTLMLLMFALGGANLGWMLALGAVMAVERVSPWGRRLTAPLGVALMAWASLLWAGIL
jgi:predicted metal-binding membrane protein